MEAVVEVYNGRAVSRSDLCDANKIAGQIYGELAVTKLGPCN